MNGITVGKGVSNDDNYVVVRCIVQRTTKKRRELQFVICFRDKAELKVCEPKILRDNCIFKIYTYIYIILFSVRNVQTKSFIQNSS